MVFSFVHPHSNASVDHNDKKFNASGTCNIKDFNNDHLAIAIKNIPSTIPLIPVIGKATKVYGWQKSNGYSLGELTKLIKNKQATGVGVLLGDKNNQYLIALDFDGPNAHLIALAAFGGLPNTVSWTSGKEGRKQDLFKLSDSQIKEIRERETKLDKKFSKLVLKDFEGIEAVEYEQLEIRGNNHQSVLGGSWHPETGEYKWINHPQDIAIAILPDSVFNYVLNKLDSEINQRQEREAKAKAAKQKYRQFSPAIGLSQDEVIESAVWSIDSSCSREEWVKVGTALKSEGEQYFSLFDQWSSSSPKYQPNKIDREWQGFRENTVSIGTLFHLAQTYGWSFPKLEKNFVKSDFTKVYEEYQRWLEEQARIEREQVNEELLCDLESVIEREIKAPWDKDFCKKEVKNSVVPFGRFESEKIDGYYEPGKRHLKIKELKAKGFTDFIDVSPTGSGKSYEVENLHPDPPHKVGDKEVVPRIWDVSQDYKNKSSSVAKGWEVLEPKHGGLYQDQGRKQDNGQSYLTAKKIEGQTPVVSANCDRPHLFRLMGDKGYEPAGGKESPICGKCPNLHLCCPSDNESDSDKQENNPAEDFVLEDSTGGYGYLGGRRLTLKQGTRILAHPASMPDPEKFDYSDSSIYVDEGGVILNAKKQYSEGVYSEVLRAIDFAISEIKKDEKCSEIESYTKYLSHLRFSLTELVFDNVPHHGYDKQAILKHIEGENEKHLYQPPEGLSKKLSEVFNRSWNKLCSEMPDTVTKAETGGGVSNTARKIARSHIKREWFKDWYRRMGEHYTLMLPTLVSILAGEQNGDIRLNRFEELMVTVRDERFNSILEAAKIRVVLDATLSRERYCDLTGRDREKVALICSGRPVDMSKLNVVVYRLGGDGSNNLTDGAVKRFANLNDWFKAQHPNSATIVPKKYLEVMGGDAYDFGQTRGSNIFSGKDLLYKCCLPDFGEIKTDYELESPNMTLSEYYHSRIIDNFVQVIGRTRFVRSEQELTVTMCLPRFISLESLQSRGIPAVERELAIDCPAAAPKRKIRAVDLCKTIFKNLRARVGRITQEKLAKAMQFSQSNLSRYLSSLGVSLKEILKICAFLYRSYIEKRINLTSIADNPDAQALSDALNLDTASFIEFLISEFRQSPKLVLDLVDGVEAIIPEILEKLFVLGTAIANQSLSTPPPEGALHFGGRFLLVVNEGSY